MFHKVKHQNHDGKQTHIAYLSVDTPPLLWLAKKLLCSIAFLWVANLRCENLLVSTLSVAFFLSISSTTWRWIQTLWGVPLNPAPPSLFKQTHLVPHHMVYEWRILSPSIGFFSLGVGTWHEKVTHLWMQFITLLAAAVVLLLHQVIVLSLYNNSPVRHHTRWGAPADCAIIRD